MSRVDKFFEKLSEKLEEKEVNDKTKLVITIEQDGKVIDKIEPKAGVISLLKDDLETTYNLCFCKTTAMNMMKVLESLDNIENNIMEKLIGGLLDKWEN